MKIACSYQVCACVERHVHVVLCDERGINFGEMVFASHDEISLFFKDLSEATIAAFDMARKQ